ncbi:septum formation protein Maf [Victivallaceae bacterium BBE-744-WT-12]|uniref:dTTP/UTP pyrophosphatase n=2 Tax=Victivallis lenta TaxID=2606640 RepID=A0A844G081_9BACT|nr:septum formation protein Maf [Victivallis lenta]
MPERSPMLILASNSPRRRELLLSLGIPFAVEAADIEEIESLDDPREVPLRNAERKAAAVAARHPHDPVLGADTVIVFRDAVIGKPRDEADALRILLSLAGKTHEVVTGLALLRCADGFRRIWRETTRVTFKPFGRETAERYLSLVSVLDKAGAYAIQESGEFLVESVDGSIENVIGLPLERLQEELMRLND